MPPSHPSDARGLGRHVVEEGKHPVICHLQARKHVKAMQEGIQCRAGSLAGKEDLKNLPAAVQPVPCFSMHIQLRAPDLTFGALSMQLCADRVLRKCGAFSCRYFCRFIGETCCFAVWVIMQSQADDRSWILLRFKP